MRGNLQVVEYLDMALGHDPTAINQYWLHIVFCPIEGYKTLAKIWRKEAIEEMLHAADRTIDRLIVIDGAPNMQILETLYIKQ